MFCVLLACHVNILCDLLACFKKGLNGFAALAVGLEQLAELGGEKLQKHSPSKPEECHAGLVNRLLAERQLHPRPWRRMGIDLACQGV